MSVIQNIEVSVSEGLICETLYGHACETFDIRPNIRYAVFRESSIESLTLQYSVGVAKLSVEGFCSIESVQLGILLHVRYTE